MALPITPYGYTYVIQEHRQLSVQDLSNRGNDVSLEINWSKDKFLKDCKYVKIKIGDGPESIVKRDHLFEVLMLMADEKQQDRMVGNYMTYQKLKNYRTVIDIQATANIQKGQVYGIPIGVSVNEATGGITVKPG